MIDQMSCLFMCTQYGLADSVTLLFTTIILVLVSPVGVVRFDLFTE